LLLLKAVISCKSVLDALHALISKSFTEKPKRIRERRETRDERRETSNFTAEATPQADLAAILSLFKLFANVIDSIMRQKTQEKLSKIAANLGFCGDDCVSVSSSETEYPKDDKVLWKEFRDDLKAQGFESSDMGKRKDAVMDYILIKLGDREYSTLTSIVGREILDMIAQIHEV
jgi:hypothetical protein